VAKVAQCSRPKFSPVIYLFILYITNYESVPVINLWKCWEALGQNVLKKGAWLHKHTAVKNGIFILWKILLTFQLEYSRYTRNHIVLSHICSNPSEQKYYLYFIINTVNFLPILQYMENILMYCIDSAHISRAHYWILSTHVIHTLQFYRS